MNARKLRNSLVAPVYAAAVIVASLTFALPAHAYTILPDCARNQAVGAAAPGLDCVEQTFLSVANLIFAISGSAALLFFVIGGFTILSSAGNESKVTKGKEYLKNAVIGLFIIFTSAYVIQYGVGLLRGGKGAVGQCGSGTVSYYTDAKGAEQPCCGQVVSAGGKEQCIVDCASYGKVQGVQYKCTETKTRSNGTDGCVPQLCKGTGPTNLCCPPEVAPDVIPEDTTTPTPATP